MTDDVTNDVQHLDTEISIKGTPVQVWGVLTDFATCHVILKAAGIKHRPGDKK